MELFFPIPGLILLFAAVICLFWAQLFPNRRGLALICLFTLLALAVVSSRVGGIGGLSFDRLSNFGFSLVIIFQIFILGILKIFMDQTNSKDLFVYFFFVTTTFGLYLSVHSYNLLAFFVGLELTLISLLFLGLSSQKKRTIEAGYRFMFHNLVGTFFLVLVILYFYSHFETLQLPAQSISLSSAQTIPIILLFLGIAYKIGLGPFYFWHLDWLTAAPMPITVIMSTSYRIALLFFLFRLFRIYLPQVSPQWLVVVAGLSLFSLTVPLLHALGQTNFKRGFSIFLFGQLGLFFLPLALQPVEAQPVVLFILLTLLAGLVGLIALVALYNPGDRKELHEIDPGSSKELYHNRFSWAFLWLSLGLLPPTVGFVIKIILADVFVILPPIFYFLLFLSGYLLLVGFCMKSAINCPVAMKTATTEGGPSFNGKIFLKLSLSGSIFLTAGLLFTFEPVFDYLRYLLIY